MLRSKQRIVLVEDNPGDAFLAWERLTEAHQATVQVDVVPTLAETLALLALGPVDAIVLDLSLPDSHGLDTLRRVRAASGHAPIIVVTGHVDVALRNEALAAGAEEIYDKGDTNSCLFSRSVLYVVERNRARVQHARLQVLLDTLPDAIVIADEEDRVRFANPAAFELFGQSEAGLLGEQIDFSAPCGDAMELSIRRDDKVQRCEMRLVPIEWEGQAARLASVRALPSPPQAEAAPAQAPEAAVQHHRVEHAARLKNEILASMSLQIRAQMHAVSGLSDLLERSGLDPLQSCYIHNLQRANDSLLSALDDLPESPQAPAAATSTAMTPENLNSVLMQLSARRSQQENGLAAA